MNTRVLERHPSFPDGMPAMMGEPEPVDHCTDCECLAAQIRASDALGDPDGAVAYGRAAIEHVAAAHGGAA